MREAGPCIDSWFRACTLQTNAVLVGVVGLEHCPVNQKVMGSILGQAHAWVADLFPGPGVYERQLVDVSHFHVYLFLSPSLSLFLKSISMSSGEDLKK